MRQPASIVRPGFLGSVCWQSTRRLVRQSGRRNLSKAAAPPAWIPLATGPRLRAGYFLSNSLLGRFGGSNAGRLPPGSEGLLTTGASFQQPEARSAYPPPSSTSVPHPNAHLPHRRRQAARRNGDYTRSAPAATTADTSHLPPADASAILAHLASRQPDHSIRRTFSALLSLTKPRLTALVVLSAMVPYALYPVPAFLSANALADAAPSLSPLTLLFLTAGTTLCSAAANSLNMLYEHATDAKMSRTRLRPLVRHLVSPTVALLFALGCAATGTIALWLGVNPTVAGLGFANIVLYAGVYTPLKRVSCLNTWVGAVVGGIPPLMGWAAAAGESATGDGGWRELLFSFPAMAAWWRGDTSEAAGADAVAVANQPPSSAGGWLFAGVLFAWQFPHFMALSWPVREEYRAAGLKMLSWVNPARNGRVALRYSLVFIPLCVGLCASGTTEWSFAVTSLPVNAWLARESVRFWRLGGHAGSAKGLFWASVWHLPVVMVLALVQKKGMWGRVWRSVTGAPDEDDDWDDWEDEEP